MNQLSDQMHSNKLFKIFDTIWYRKEEDDDDDKHIDKGEKKVVLSKADLKLKKLQEQVANPVPALKLKDLVKQPKVNKFVLDDNPTVDVTVESVSIAKNKPKSK